MNANENPKRLLNQAIDEVRNVAVPPRQVEEAAARVRHRLQAEFNKVVTHPAASEASNADRIESCADFRALIPAYLTASLTPSRKLLFEDHTRECVACHKALEAGRRGSPLAASSRVARVRRIQMKHLRWAAPVAAVLAIAVALQTTPVRDWLWPVDVHGMVQMVEGGLFRIAGHVRAISVGQRIERNETVRTGAGSGAMIELADGTRVEMAARSELSLGRARDGVRIQLARGNVIVKAAKQHGHLYVETNDASVAVVGTIFSVSFGLKGSRVTVVEGQVQVTQNGVEQSVLPGQQVVTNPEMGIVALGTELAWSRDAEELFKELAAFGQDLAARTENAAMRYTSSLVPLAPADTLVLASLPNVSQPFSQSYLLFKQRMGENTTLANWWRTASNPSTGLSVDEIAQSISDVGAYLGPEVVLALPKDMKDRLPVLVAEAAQPQSLVVALEAKVRRLAEVNTGDPVTRLAQNDEELAGMSGPGLVIYVGNGIMVASDAGQVQRTAAMRRGTLASGFAGTPLYIRLEQAYSQGVGWLLAVDLQQIVRGSGGPEISQLGIDNVQQLLLEQKTGPASAASMMTLGFAQERHGLAAWLAAPAPMGALEFVSPNAYGFSSWIVKDPKLILDDIFNLAQGIPDAAQHLREFEETHRVDLRRDLAEPLGNEVLVAIDGPVLPTPSWKVVFEVNDVPKLESAIQWAITNVNRELESRQRPTWSIESETVEGKTYYALKSMGSPLEIHYTSWVGYMIVAPSRALLMESIRVHDSGTSIARSEVLRAHLPPDGRDVASGIMYQNVEAMAQGVSGLASDAISPEFRNQLRQVTTLQSATPKVAFVYGDQDRIVGSARGSFGIQIAGMLGLHGMMGAAGAFNHLGN